MTTAARALPHAVDDAQSPVVSRARLRRSNLSQPGWTRERRGDRVRYRDERGRLLTDPEALRRLDALAIPPAWADVWISPHPHGHIQAVGTDAAGRRQYRYHDHWRERRDAVKFDRLLTVAAALPRVRDQVSNDLQLRGLQRDRILACAVRLLDLGFFRVGGERYAERNGSYGLSTLRRDHVTVRGCRVTFDYVAKSGKHRVQTIVDEPVARCVRALLKRPGRDPSLFGFYTPQRQWQRLRGSDINAHLRHLAGCDVSAKDFRTWSATVLAAVALAVSEPVAASPAARARAVRRAVVEVATYLGNTPAVCRASYIDPRVIDRYADGIVLDAAVLDRLATSAHSSLATHGAVEAAVLELLRTPRRRARPQPGELAALAAAS